MEIFYVNCELSGKFAENEKLNLIGWEFCGTRTFFPKIDSM